MCQLLQRNSHHFFLRKIEIVIKNPIIYPIFKETYILFLSSMPSSAKIFMKMKTFLGNLFVSICFFSRFVFKALASLFTSSFSSSFALFSESLLNIYLLFWLFIFVFVKVLGIAFLLTVALLFENGCSVVQLFGFPRRLNLFCERGWIYWEWGAYPGQSVP